MSRIVHLGTALQSRFGYIDDDDNVIALEPITANLPVFSAEQFAEAFDGIRDARDEAVKAIPSDPAG